MNPFLLPPKERLSHWKTMRMSLPLLSDKLQLETVAKYWAQAPQLKFSYDMEEPKQWTTPWEMIHANRWCRFSTAIGMEFTLRLSGFDSSRIVLKFICDYDLCDTFFVVEIDKKYWLNHEFGKVINVPTYDYETMCSWKYINNEYVSSLVPKKIIAFL